MTVQKELTKNIYVGNGQTTKFPFTFECPDNHPEYIRVYVAGKKNELTATTNFGVDMANKSITYPANGEPLAIDEQLVIMRELPVRQLMNLVNNGPYFAEDIETAFDEGIMIAQQSSEKLGRALVAPPTSTTFDTQIPIEPGKTFRISDDGTHLQATEDPGKVIDEAKGLLSETTIKAEETAANTQEAKQANAEIKTIYNNGSLTPITNLAGSIGTALKRWGYIFANKVFAMNLPIVHKSVAEMKADSLLSADMTACTLGYYAPNDGGAGTYIIRAKADGDVDDGGSLHELANGNVAELVVENGTVNVKQFGAKGDGVTNDTDAFQKALNSNKTVTVTNGTYYLNNTIDNPQIIKIVGEDKHKTKLKLNNSFLKNKIQYSEIKNIGFSCTQTNDITVFPSLVYNSNIKDNVFTYFKNIFANVENLTHIENNHFSFIQGYFCNKIVDSFVNGNYINAPKTKSPQTIAFKDVAHTRITNNFIDFMYKVFERKTVGNSKAIIVVGNTFDVCFCIFYNTCVGVTFTGNSITNMERLRVIKTETNPNGWDVSGNEEMNTTDWCVIKRINDKGGFYDSVLANNTVYDMRLDKYLICTSYSYPTHDVMIDEILPNDKFIYKAYKSRNERDFESIMIKPMLKRTVETLPSAELSGDCTTFNNDEVVYNGDLYVNLNGVWKKIS